MENLQKRYYQQIFQPLNHLLLGEIILNKGKIIPYKEELVVDKETKISSLKLGGDKILPQEGRGDFREPNPISRKDPPLGKVINSNCTCSLLSLHIFADLIIRETADPPSPDRSFFVGYITLPRKLGYQGSHYAADA